MNFLKASKEKFAEIGFEITAERQMPDGEFIKHFETCDPAWVQAWGKPGFTALTDEEVKQPEPLG